MRRSRANLPNRCCRQIDRIAYRAFQIHGERPRDVQKRATKIVCKVAGLAAGMNEAAGDSTSRYAGLDDYPEARRTALKGAIDMSHAEYPISRNSKRGTHTIKKLAARYWKANEDRLKQLAKLPNGAGFKNAESLASNLWGETPRGVNTTPSRAARNIS